MKQRRASFTPKACAPYRARTKGKTENGVCYVKKNAVAGRTFATWAAFEAHLAAWTRDIADTRIHGTTGEPPIERFQREEATALKSVAGIPPFHAARELIRVVQSDCCVEIDTNAYSVPWRLIGDSVRVLVTADAVRVNHAGREVAVHERRTGKRERAREASHFDGVSGFSARVQPASADVLPIAMPPPDALLRPLAEYEALAGGAF